MGIRPLGLRAGLRRDRGRRAARPDCRPLLAQPRGADRKTGGPGAAAIDDPQHKKNAAIIEECLREILFKASGAKTKEEFENIHAAAYCDAAKVLNAKMVKVLMGDLKTQEQKDKPEYKAEKENKKRNAQILALNNESQQLENELKNLPPINFKDERMEKHFNAGFVATIEETIGFLNNKLKYKPREVVKNATEQALKCLNQIKDAVEKGELCRVSFICN